MKTKEEFNLIDKMKQQNNELEKGTGIGLLIASVPIILTYIFFQLIMPMENYDLSLFITYTIVAIAGLLILRKKMEKS